MEERNLYVVYQTDEWHSIDCRRCKGVFESKQEAIAKIVDNHKISPLEWDDMTADEFKEELASELDSFSQTQGYSTNYEIDEVTLNEWA